MISRLAGTEKIFDFVVIGGGATGLGVALDAATRGFSVALFEQGDFTKGTSSRSTKLVHGGVRYLAQGDVWLVLEALRERGLLRRNAPHLVKDQTFLIPCFQWWEAPFYTLGLILYDLMSGPLSFGPSRYLGAHRASRLVPGLAAAGLSGGVVYHDGQFDDSRLAMDLLRSAAGAGACLLNYMPVVGLRKTGGKITGVEVADLETGRQYSIQARTVINATGVFADQILQMDQPGRQPTVRPSQGVHLVLDASFLAGNCAVMIPKTSDGRVLFAVPWHGKVVVGTTDTLRSHPDIEPVALEEEIRFILDTAGRYLARPPRQSDVLSVFAGLRPLAAPSGEGKATKEISRSHKLIVEPSGLLTIIGGKWTTYRKMAEDTVDRAIRLAGWPERPCATKRFALHGAEPDPDFSDPLYVYGTDAPEIRRLAASSPRMGERLHPDYPHTAGEVVWIIRHEMPCRVEDILGRRLRMLFLDVRAAVRMAPRVAALMAAEQGRGEEWAAGEVAAFRRLAANYLPAGVEIPGGIEVPGGVELPGGMEVRGSFEMSGGSGLWGGSELSGSSGSPGQTGLPGGINQFKCDKKEDNDGAET